MANITVFSIQQSPHSHTPLLECLRRFAHNPVLINEIPDIERPCVIVLVCKGYLRAWRDGQERFGYEITESGLQALEG